MKKNTFCLLLILFVNWSYAQDFSLRYGKVNIEEIAMSSYDKDTTANAIVIYKKGNTYYEYINNNFQVVYNYETKIKILNQEGVKYADIIIPVYHEEKQNQRKEALSRLEAHAYNIENGKITKTKMDKSYIYEERVSPYRKHIKFSIPTVKAGTVIEFKYRITSDYYTSLNDWEIQTDIPVHFAQYEIRIPEYFNFSLNSKGFEIMDVKETTENQNFTINVGKGQSENVTCSSRKIIFTSNNVPALKDDGYVWCIDDFSSQVTFELNGIQFPYDIYRPFTNSWQDIEKLLKESDGWGNYLTFRNPYKEEMKQLPLAEMNNENKISSIFQLLKSKIKWNEKYGFYGNDTRKAIKDGTGTNAEINFVLLSMLKDANITAYPILLSSRPRGRLPYTHPSFNAINTFVIGAMSNDTTMVYLDGSVEYGDINILPSILMADRARVFHPQREGYWINLSDVGTHRTRMLITASINEDIKLIGERQTSYNGLYASSYKKSFYNAKDSTEFIEEIEKEREITLTSFEHTEIEKYSPQVKQKIGFEKSITHNDQYIYLNPMIFPDITTNPFIEEERKLPVEFSFPYEKRITVSLTIPEGYEVEELPESIRFMTEKGEIICGYTIQNNLQHLVVNYILQFKTVIFPAQDYISLKTFWEKLVEKNTAQIILKKKAI